MRIRALGSLACAAILGMCSLMPTAQTAHAAPKATVEGTVYIDANWNYTRDPDEVGLAGATVTVIERYEDSSGIVSEVHRYTTTDDAGHYSVEVDPTSSDIEAIVTVPEGSDVGGMYGPEPFSTTPVSGTTVQTDISMHPNNPDKSKNVIPLTDSTCDVVPKIVALEDFLDPTKGIVATCLGVDGEQYDGAWMLVGRSSDIPTYIQQTSEEWDGSSGFTWNTNYLPETQIPFVAFGALQERDADGNTIGYVDGVYRIYGGASGSYDDYQNGLPIDLVSQMADIGVDHFVPYVNGVPVDLDANKCAMLGDYFAAGIDGSGNFNAAWTSFIVTDPNGICTASTPEPVTIGDYVWEDVNWNGVQDSGEPGIPGVTVTATDTDGNATTAVTDSTGHYSFTDLPAGTYTVKVTNPTGYTPTRALAGSDRTVDSSTGSERVTLAAGESDTTIDFGFTSNPAHVGNFVWEDINANGIQDEGEPGISGVKVTITGGPRNLLLSMDTGLTGGYSFGNLPAGEYTVTVQTPDGYTPSSVAQGSDTALDSNASPQTVTLERGENNTTIDFGFVPVPTPAALGDFVWEDLNKNGVQDAGEPGVPNVTVTLRLADGSGETKTATTDSTGHYSFTDLPADTYTVKVTVPNGYSLTIANQGTPDVDSETAGTNVGLAPGQINNTIDFGLVANPVTIGDFVWEDTNKNGIQDEGEPGIPGVTVIATDKDGVEIATTTDADGHYTFTDLPAGTYTVTVVDPDGYTPTVSEQGDDRGTDSSTGSASTTLANGQSDTTLDFGYTPKPGSIGDYVWNDTNGNGVQDENEPGIPGVIVTITDKNGNVKETVTDDSGHYTFADLPAGTYIVTVIVPDGWKSTITGQGTTETDSFDGPQTVQIGRDQTDNSVDFGMVKIPEETPAPEPTPEPEPTLPTGGHESDNGHYESGARTGMPMTQTSGLIGLGAGLVAAGAAGAYGLRRRHN